MTDVVDSSSVLNRYPKTARLAAEILSGKLCEIRPTVDLSSDLGFTYSHVEGLLQVTAQGAFSLLELMANGDILEKHFHDKFLLCPNCHSPNLRPSLCCPKCGSCNIVKGRILEHFACGAVTVENECMVSGKYICPKCKKEFKFLGTDYGSLGVNHKCYNCGDITAEATLKWRCPKCSISLDSNEAKEIVMYSYRLKEEKRAELAFDLGPRARLIDFLSAQGYAVTERIIVNGASKSGAGHMLDLLARRDDGIVTQTIAIGILIDSR
jgi:predicted  nucleic acid-binding Zn-ribbon protein